MGLIFGTGLLFAGNWIHNRPHIANGKHISQALSGAGIADLYVCIFAATSFYELIPSLVGFLGMAAVTAIAVVLSLRQGPAIALLGMLGGFVTPALLGSQEPNAKLLFMYLYFVLAGLLMVIRKRNWWPLSIPVILGAFIWVCVWLGTSYSPDDGIWLGIFLIAMSGTLVYNSKKAMEHGSIERFASFKLTSLINYFSMGGSVLLMSAIGAKSHFRGMEWALFGLLATGGIVLSYYNQKLYGFIPWISALLTFTMLGSWSAADPTLFTVTLLAFALLYTLSTYWLMWNTPKPLPWCILSAFSGLLFYILAYAKFHNWTNEALLPFETWYADANLWASLALGAFVLSITAVMHLLNRFQDEDEIKQNLLTVFTLTATAFLSICLTLELSSDFLTIALAAEIFSICWLNNHVHIKILRPLAGALSILFGVLLSLIFWLDLHHFLVNRLPTINWSLSHLGLPALFFISSSFYLRQQKDDYLSRAFEMTAIGLIAVLIYYLSHHVFQTSEDFFISKTSFFERGIITNIYFLYGLACLWIGRTFKRIAVSRSGILLIGLALLRIVFFDLLFDNPLWTHQDIGNLPIINALLLSFGFPILWLSMANKELIEIGKQQLCSYTNIFLFLFLFFFVSFNVRQFYQGAYLDTALMSNAEVYTYSVVWLLVGIGLLFFGTLRKNKTLRIASLAFIIMAVFKVFLYDASELTGLLRVFSFLGLGISLLGLSWFYTRFVFKRI